MERPYGFSSGHRHFFLYPVTLGKMFLINRQIENLEINQQILTFNPSLEAVRLVREKKNVCLSIIAYYTCKDKSEVFLQNEIETRKDLFGREMSDEELATLMITVLTNDKTGLFIKHLGIDREQERMRKVMAAKKSKNNINFGGKSYYGSLIDAACERYGWTLEYVVWGISYTNLRMLLADKVSSIYVSDDELKKLPASALNDNGVVRADSEEGKELIRSMDWS